MSDTSLNIWNGIRSIVSDSLGSSWDEMSHVIDVWDEIYSSKHQKWGVVPDGAPGNDSSSTTKRQDFDYRFVVMLGYSWISVGNTSDRAFVQKILEYQGLLEDIYVEIVKRLRAEGGTNVLNIFEPTLEAPLGLDDDKKKKRLIMQLSFTVKAKTDF